MVPVRVRFAQVVMTVTAVSLGVVGGAAYQDPDKSIRFGDVVLSGFTSAELELGVRARAVGPKTQVDAVDASRQTKARLLASDLTALMVKPKPGQSTRERQNQVARIEATGNVRFNATRSLGAGKGEQTVRATGSKAIYERVEQVLTLQGPVTFSAEQPAASGAGKETVNGTAGRAVYDEGKRILQLFGTVKATVVTPDTPEEGSTFAGDEVKIEMAEQPYRVAIANPSLSGSINIRLKEKETDK